MIFWLDAQLSPRLGRWIEETFGVECFHVRDLGLRDAEDPEIFQKARDAGAVVMTKDEDFMRLVEQMAPRRKSFGSFPAICLTPALNHFS